MSHVLIPHHIDDAWHFVCECGVYFGSVKEYLLDQCTDDVVAAHCEHVHNRMSGEQKFGFRLLEPGDRVQRTLEVDKLLKTSI